MTAIFLCLTALCITAVTVQAGEIYKSIDANGNVVYSDHLDPSLSHTTSVQLDNSQPAPHELHFCRTDCFTLLLDNGVYRRTDGTEETWTVETFSANAIVLHRHDAPADWNGYNPDVVYAGQVANDRLINVTINGKAASGVDASWGSALNTLPGSNAERDTPNSQNPSSSASTLQTSSVPPPVPEEDQPELPQDGYLWTPGYWYWHSHAYVWIPGAWMQPPQVGFLWTPAYWGRAGAVFVFYPGHWGSSVGFYGGINYGHGYVGNGYLGGHWIGDAFAYDSALNHAPATIARHTYTQAASTVPVPIRANGGAVAPTASQHAAQASQHPVPTQVALQQKAAVVRQRTENTPAPAEINRPAGLLRTPPPTVNPKVNHTPTHSAPAKQ